MELPDLSVAAILSGCLSGAILGARIGTETERRLRGGKANRPIFVNNSTTALLLNVLIPILLAGGVVLLVSGGIAKLANAYPLSLSYRREWAISLLGGLVLARWVRYLYWTNRKGFRSLKVRIRR